MDFDRMTLNLYGACRTGLVFSLDLFGFVACVLIYWAICCNFAYLDFKRPEI